MQSKRIVKPSTKDLILKFLEMTGWSLFWCLLMYLAGKFLAKTMHQDTMTFLQPKEKKKKFNARDMWVGEIPEAAREVLDIFDYPDVYTHFGSAVPKGILLHGKPGTGKTHFARVIAAMTNSEFFYASASQFDEVFVGKGAQRVRNLFESARMATQYSWKETLRAQMAGLDLPQKRVVVFIDELDAIGGRTSQARGFQNTTHATVSQLLTCLDGLNTGENCGLFVIGATNNLENIDPAIRRSGRFDRVIEMPLPNESSRLDMLRFYLADRPGVPVMEKEGILQQFASVTDGFSSADIKNMANEAIMSAVKSTIKERKENSEKKVHINEVSNKYQLKPIHLKMAFEVVKTKIKTERPADFGIDNSVMQNFFGLKMSNRKNTEKLD